ncbi:metallophosphoesterase 1 [Halyomorpha halys]|uniref:metallophosphoesterase 1 n=1 Tax=Halyomorpha halys TaxID=286706 RepID=UPI0006D4E81D|nr:metallophosphoesterase 1 [Halyomorpha halys]
MIITRSYVSIIFISIISLFIFCEFAVYYVALLQCSWPIMDKSTADPTIQLDGEPLRVMLLADTHLLGPKRGHWFDKLRREWQMQRTFQTAMSLHQPDIVFILGDLFDEGLWCSDSEFAAYVQRFHTLFRTPEGTELFVVVGNHDIGFHYGISPYLKKRFTDAFNSPSVQMFSVRGIHFVLINSMAMEGDGCFLCRSAEIQLLNLSKKLKCIKSPSSCNGESDLTQYSRPILLQHFPMHRESDEACNEPDEAPEDEKRLKFRERWDCLSKESSDMLFEMLNPRLIVTGHTHHGCRRYHKQYNAFEYTLSSFNWRNKDNPSYMLAVITANNYALEKCYMPRESTVIFLYIVGALSIIAYTIATQRRLYWRIRGFKVL